MTATTSTRSRSKSPVVGPPTNGELAALKARHASMDETPEGRSRQILVAMVAFRDGDFIVRMPTDWIGTDARIAEAFNQTIAQKQRICAEVMRLSATVGKEGRLKQRMSLPGAIGGWAAEVDSINTMIEQWGGC